MKKKKKFFAAGEDTRIYNVFNRDLDFDDDGYLIGYNGEDGYHIEDFDVVAEFDDFDEACEWVKEHTY